MSHDYLHYHHTDNVTPRLDSYDKTASSTVLFRRLKPL